MTAAFPAHKTKIVCTIGPASRQPETLRALLDAGMNVARLNMAHGDNNSRREMIAALREAAAESGRRLAILADLPGPKLRIGRLAESPIVLQRDQQLVLDTAATTQADADAPLPLDLGGLSARLAAGDTIFLNDGFLQLEVEHTDGTQVRCTVRVGGQLYSHNGVNLPGVDLGDSALTAADEELLRFALEAQIDAISVSFVQRAADITAARNLARRWGYEPFLIAKIERAAAVENIDDILREADGIMVARGDLGVETPIEGIAVTQKRLIRLANLARKPVITATQMLESMTANRRPTRAEATDVANAILDGTDCVMLSEESAIGEYPVDTVAMMAQIARHTERGRAQYGMRDLLNRIKTHEATHIADVIAADVCDAVERLQPELVVSPTESGATPRRLSSFKLPCWIVAFSEHARTCQQLCFSSGVYPVQLQTGDHHWRGEVTGWCIDRGIHAGKVVMTHGASRHNPRASTFIEIFELEGTR